MPQKSEIRKPQPMMSMLISRNKRVARPCIPKAARKANAKGIPPIFAATAEYPTTVLRNPRTVSSRTTATATKAPITAPIEALINDNCKLKTKLPRNCPVTASIIGLRSAVPVANADRKTYSPGQPKKIARNATYGKNTKWRARLLDEPAILGETTDCVFVAINYLSATIGPQLAAKASFILAI